MSRFTTTLSSVNIDITSNTESTNIVIIQGDIIKIANDGTKSNICDLAEWAIIIKKKSLMVPNINNS
jgi:hypothetical protein